MLLHQAHWEGRPGTALCLAAFLNCCCGIATFYLPGRFRWNLYCSKECQVSKCVLAVCLLDCSWVRTQWLLTVVLVVVGAFLLTKYL